MSEKRLIVSAIIKPERETDDRIKLSDQGLGLVNKINSVKAKWVNQVIQRKMQSQDWGCTGRVGPTTKVKAWQGGWY